MIPRTDPALYESNILAKFMYDSAVVEHPTISWYGATELERQAWITKATYVVNFLLPLESRRKLNQARQMILDNAVLVYDCKTHLPEFRISGALLIDIFGGIG